MLFWTRLTLRLLFWAVVALAVSAVWQRGVEKSARDAVVVGSRLVRWVNGVAGVFWREWEKAQQLGQPGQGEQNEGYQYY